MNHVVLDASVILAAILGEPGGDAVFDRLDEAVISTVNVAEVYTYAAINAFGGACRQTGPRVVRQPGKGFHEWMNFIQRDRNPHLRLIRARRLEVISRY